MAQTSFEVDAKTAQALDSLKKVYGVNSNAAVLKRALAIALVASRHADEHDNIRMVTTENGVNRELVIPQKY